MALERKTLFDRVIYDSEGNITVVVKKAIVDGDELVSEQPHTILIPSGANIAAYLQANSEGLQRLGFPALGPEVLDKPTLVREQMGRALPTPVPKPRGRSK